MPLGIGLVTVFVAQLFDFATFVTMVRREGLTAEVNPLVLGVLDSSGLIGVVVTKLALFALVAAAALLLTEARRPGYLRVRSLLIVAAVLAGVFGGWTNAITIGL